MHTTEEYLCSLKQPFSSEMCWNILFFEALELLEEFLCLPLRCILQKKNVLKIKLLMSLKCFRKRKRSVAYY